MSDVVSIKAGGQSISGWTGVTIEQAIDNCADAFSISAPFDPDREDLRERFKPFGYKPCKVLIDDQLIITGRIEKVEPLKPNRSRCLQSRAGILQAFLLIAISTRWGISSTTSVLRIS